MASVDELRGDLGYEVSVSDVGSRINTMIFLSLVEKLRKVNGSSAISMGTLEGRTAKMFLVVDDCQFIVSAELGTYVSKEISDKWSWEVFRLIKTPPQGCRDNSLYYSEWLLKKISQVKRKAPHLPGIDPFFGASQRAFDVVMESMSGTPTSDLFGSDTFVAFGVTGGEDQRIAPASLIIWRPDGRSYRLISANGLNKDFVDAVNGLGLEPNQIFTFDTSYLERVMELIDA